MKSASRENKYKNEGLYSLSKYNPQLLYPLPRYNTNCKTNNLPFQGYDIWNAYELSWLNPVSKPVVAIARIIIPSNTLNIIESKSMKLYLNSFSDTIFGSISEIKDTIYKDLSQNLKSSDLAIDIYTEKSYPLKSFTDFSSLNAILIDDINTKLNLDIKVRPEYLQTENYKTEEHLFSNILKTNCPITNQPDWASLYIHYAGNKINKANLLNYIVSYRNHQAFHEECVEKIFLDIYNKCNPELLTVFAFYTRRGGIDICPVRSTLPRKKIHLPLPIRFFRQ